MFFDFLRLRFFKILPKKFWRLAENPENIFLACEKFPELFPGKICTRTRPQTRIIPGYLKNPSNPTFSDVNSIAGCQGHLQAVSFEKPHKLRARKRCPQKP
ncbi:MAG: hypothetical protein NTZ24_09510, partial [Deltaproteobacteria bacterium]|nr:hypothetical protein [Deltaproteobacteria bacterium]